MEHLFNNACVILGCVILFSVFIIIGATLIKGETHDLRRNPNRQRTGSPLHRRNNTTNHKD